MESRAQRRQGTIGLLLAAGIVAAWLAVHVYGVFFLRLTPRSIPFALAAATIETWLGVGMFIVAHDAMHGSLAPGRPGLNRLMGQVALGLYAGFDFGKLDAKHHAHHRAPGSADDPDFHVAAPTAFWGWYLRFFVTYFGWWEFARLSAAIAAYLFIFRASPLNMVVFWAGPAILSSLQLFAFGTWLPHRHNGEGFADHHNARSLGFGWAMSLLTCFHFGMHREHHLRPDAPWWRLPAVRREGVA